MSRPFRARYPGRCPSCGERIDVGDWICYVDDDVACEACRNADRRYDDPRMPACARCRLAANGILVDGLCPDCRADA